MVVGSMYLTVDLHLVVRNEGKVDHAQAADDAEIEIVDILFIRYVITKVPKQCLPRGIGCGSVGRTVASDTRALQFESSHRQKFY